MKKLFSLLCLVVAASVATAQQLPDVKVENAQGKIVSVRSIANGKPMIISYWSIACKPCIQELNAINDALAEWREEADLEVVAVSTDDARLKATAKAIATSRGWEFICLFDENQELKRAMNVSLTPQSFVVDGEGNIIFSHSGYTPGSEQLLFDKIVELKKGAKKKK
ncbi:MAG: TlpA family protein disulfide reductase [Alistipes sp.]|nr:TlpA family protein disulfide reductase [Alistipes sp.]